MRRRWLWWALGIGGVAVVLLGAAARALEARRFQATLDQARSEVEHRLYHSARARLERMAGRGASSGEADYLLGLCERALQHPDAALAAWARVPPRSPFAVPAAVQRAALAKRGGRYALAEQTLMPLRDDPRPQAVEVRELLIALFLMQGRFDEIFPLFEANWRALGPQRRLGSDAALEVLRKHIALHVDTPAVIAVEGILGHAARQAPDDDRVWLGLANLAIQTGQYAAAADRLDACLRRRPDDPAVWRARLDWALATDQVDAAHKALAHLSADRFSAGRVAMLRAWLAARRGDAVAERAALEAAVAADPSTIAAWERLAVLAIAAGQDARAAQYRRRKAELDQAKNRYQKLYKDNNLAIDAAEMAHLAETLGDRFEAIGLSTWVLDHDPTHRAARALLDRLERGQPPPHPAGLSLAQLLADVLDRTPTPPPTTRTRPAPQFTDDARAVRLDFTFDSGQTSFHEFPEVSSGGLALLDYDSDGWLDLYAVQGGRFPPDLDHVHTGDRLFRNRRDGTFDDVSASTGIAAMPRGYGHGVAVGDIDNDGHPDLFITRWRSYALYRNRGDGTFEDVTERTGLGGDRDWPTSAAFADLDNDGDLDLYVCHYLVWDEKNPVLCPNPSGPGFVSCDPRRFEAQPDHVFRNDGGRFVDVTAQAGMVERTGRGLGVVAADLDADGRVDLFVANDGSANFLWHNLGGLHFEEIGLAAGVASNAEGGYQAGMGVACGDFDRDGRPDLVVTNFEGESTTFYQNLGRGLFADRTAAIGLAAPSRYLLGFGVAWLDANNDGWLDLMTANGHVSDFGPRAAYRMPVQLLLGDERGRLSDVSRQAGAPFQALHLGRGLAAGDLDNDGRVDAVMLAQDEPLVYLHNRTDPAGHFVMLSLEGRQSNRDAIGARVVVEAGARRLAAWRSGGGSYQSAGDPRLHVGLGSAARVNRLEVSWPSGRVDRYQDVAVDRGYRLREGDPEPAPLAGWVRRR